MLLSFHWDVLKYVLVFSLEYIQFLYTMLFDYTLIWFIEIKWLYNLITGMVKILNS